MMTTVLTEIFRRKHLHKRDRVNAEFWSMSYNIFKLHYNGQTSLSDIPIRTFE